jgi:HlyD family secretion protein
LQAAAEDQEGETLLEIESIKAQLGQAQLLWPFRRRAGPAEELSRSGASTPQDLDRARSMHDQNREKVAQLEADLQTAQLGSRTDQIAAAQANVQALEATLAVAEWNLSQKRQTAPQAGLVFDTMYRQGEWVPAGRPVVALLPPANIKVRAFVPEPQLQALHPGDNVQVVVDGLPGPLAGRISFISPRAEYTPPVIYNRENRAKLVFLIEVTFDPPPPPHPPAGGRRRL